MEELIKYLREHNLPENEGTYPPELLAQITIRAFDELFERLRTTEEDCADDIADLEYSLIKNEGRLTRYFELKEVPNLVDLRLKLQKLLDNNKQ